LVTDLAIQFFSNCWNKDWSWNNRS